MRFRKVSDAQESLGKPGAGMQATGDLVTSVTQQPSKAPSNRTQAAKQSTVPRQWSKRDAATTTERIIRVWWWKLEMEIHLEEDEDEIRVIGRKEDRFR